MKVLIDSSTWIDYFRSGDNMDELDHLIDNDLIFTNDLILTELLPFLRLQHQTPLLEIINEIAKLPLLINWQQIQEFQFACLKNGINGIGIPDLIIAQNSIQNDSLILSSDKHFQLMQDVLNFKLYK